MADLKSEKEKLPLYIKVAPTAEDAQDIDRHAPLDKDGRPKKARHPLVRLGLAVLITAGLYIALGVFTFGADFFTGERDGVEFRKWGVGEFGGGEVGGRRPCPHHEGKEGHHERPEWAGEHHGPGRHHGPPPPEGHHRRPQVDGEDGERTHPGYGAGGRKGGHRGFGKPTEMWKDPFRETKKKGDRVPIPLEAHIMSKCPDTKACLHDLVIPAMQKVHDKVDFNLSFLGRATSDDGVECMHGPGECMGDILELCAAHLYPNPRIYLGFTMCLSQEYPDIPERELVQQCALEHAVDFEELNKCASADDGSHGLALLRKSVSRSRDAGVSTSCTVRLNNEVFCVHDDGQWKDCPHGSTVNDLVLSIEKLYREQPLKSDD